MALVLLPKHFINTNESSVIVIVKAAPSELLATDNHYLESSTQPISSRLPSLTLAYSRIKR